jgi:hypothetical protein
VLPLPLPLLRLDGWSGRVWLAHSGWLSCSSCVGLLPSMLCRAQQIAAN